MCGALLYVVDATSFYYMYSHFVSSLLGEGENLDEFG